MEMPHLFVITGPTAVGEDSIINGLRHKRDFHKITTTTSRPKRPSEKEGSPYYFVSKEDFEKMISCDGLVEYVKGANQTYYGVTKAEFAQSAKLEKPVIWKVDYKGAITARELFPDCTIIYITVPSDNVIRKRLTKRDKNATEDYIEDRLRYAQNWKRHLDLYDYTVVNADTKLHESIDKVDSIIEKSMTEGASSTPQNL